MVWKVAAAIVFIFLATNQAFIYFTPDGQGIFDVNDQSQSITLATFSPEYREVEYYYTTSINFGIGQWNRLMEEGLISDEEQIMLNEELAEFETLYENLQKDLAANPNDQRVINAMLEYYQAKLSVINLIITKLEEVQQKTQEFEQETSAI